jgi:hypothetical protein
MIFARALGIGAALGLMFFPFRLALAQTPNAARDKCPVTTAPQTPFVPSGAAPPVKGAFFFGTAKLAVLLNQTWTVRQVNSRWFSDDAHATPPPLNMKLTGRRLNPDVAYVANPNPPGPRFAQGPSITRGTLILGSIEFPSIGCWEVTARLNDTELRFVVYIER